MARTDFLRLDEAAAMEPDYIVVGAGPGGCVMASRLSEDPAVKVLLLEGGRDCDNLRVKLPIGHAPHDAIRNLGQGRYSHWGRRIYFAASDNSDPRRNGRRARPPR